MKRIYSAVAMVLCCLSTSVFAQWALPCKTQESSAGKIAVNPYAQVGFQWVGSNLNLPASDGLLVTEPFSLGIGHLDISLKDANFWTGIAGVNVLAYGKYSLFGAAGGFLNRPFITSGTAPVSLDAINTSGKLEFTNTKVESWFIQTGIGLGPVLFGLYWDHFTFHLADPRNNDGPLPNQTLRGDMLTKTFAPFIGFALPVSSASITVTYSPLAYSDTALSLINSRRNLSEIRYTWKKPGDLVNALLQYNTPVTSTTTFGVWSNYSWMRMRGSAELEFENTRTPPINRNKDVTATMTKYVVGGGVTLGVNF